MKNFRMGWLISIVFMGMSNVIYNSEKRKKFLKAGALATIGSGTTFLLKDQFSGKAPQERKSLFLDAIHKNPQVHIKIKALNDTIHTSLSKNIYFYKYRPSTEYVKLPSKHSIHPQSLRGPAKGDTVIQKKAIAQAFQAYIKTISKNTVKHYKDELNTILSTGAMITLPIAGYIIGRCSPIIVNNPRTVIPMLISRALITGILGELTISTATAYADKNADFIIEKSVKLYEKYEPLIHTELDKWITNEVQTIREQLENNGVRLITRLIKKQPVEKTMFIVPSKEDSEQAFAEFNKNYLQSEERSFFMRHMIQFFIPNDLKTTRQITHK